MLGTISLIIAGIQPPVPLYINRPRHNLIKAKSLKLISITRRHRKLLAEKKVSWATKDVVLEYSQADHAMENSPSLWVPLPSQESCVTLPLSLHQNSHDLKEIWLKQLNQQKNCVGKLGLS